MMYIYEMHTGVKPGKSNYSFCCVLPAYFQSKEFSLCFHDAKEQAQVILGRLLCFEKLLCELLVVLGSSTVRQ